MTNLTLQISTYTPHCEFVGEAKAGNYILLELFIFIVHLEQFRNYCRWWNLEIRKKKQKKNNLFGSGYQRLSLKTRFALISF